MHSDSILCWILDYAACHISAPPFCSHSFKREDNAMVSVAQGEGSGVRGSNRCQPDVRSEQRGEGGCAERHKRWHCEPDNGERHRERQTDRQAVTDRQRERSLWSNVRLHQVSCELDKMMPLMKVSLCCPGLSTQNL